MSTVNLNELNLTQGGATQTNIWAELWWLYGGGSRSDAVRRSVADGLWWLTTGYVENTEVTHGPFESLEQVEMLIRMEVIDDYAT